MSKIAILECAQNYGGARIAALQMAKSLKVKHEVFLIDCYGTCEPFVSSCIKSQLPFKILLKDSNPFYIRASKSLIERLINIILFIPHLVKLGRELKRYVRENHIEFLCVSTFRPLYCLYLSKIENINVFYFAHGWYLNEQISVINRFFLRKIPSRIICISEATRHAIFNNKIKKLNELSVIQNAIDPKQLLLREGLNYQVENDRFTILLSGGFIPLKGHHIALEIAKKLKSAGINFKVVLAGIIYHSIESSRYYKKILEEISNAKLEDNVSLIINSTNIYREMYSADVIIHPSATEGFPLSILEAQAMGKPVIANPVGGVIDMIQDNHTGFIVDYNDIDEYVSILIKLYNDNNLYKKISRQAYELVLNSFCVERQITKLEKLFR